MSTITPTSTTTRSESTLELRVELRSGRSVVTRCRGQVPLAPRLLRGRGRARVALVQTAAGLLSGDRVGLEIEVGAGAALELTTLAATIAFPAREEARQSLACTVAAGGRFAWLPEPLILAGGCRLASTVELALAAGAAAVVRELAVLGRHGEAPGACNGALRCDLGGVPLLRDSLLVEPGTSRSTVRLGGARAYLSLALLGLDGAAQAGDDELELAGPGRLLRAYGPDAAGVLRTLRAHEPSYLDRLWGSPSA